MNPAQLAKCPREAAWGSPSAAHVVGQYGRTRAGDAAPMGSDCSRPSFRAKTPVADAPGSSPGASPGIAGSSGRGWRQGCASCGNKLQKISERFRGASQKFPRNSERFREFREIPARSEGLSATWREFLADEARFPRRISTPMFSMRRGGCARSAARWWDPRPARELAQRRPRRPLVPLPPCGRDFRSPC